MNKYYNPSIYNLTKYLKEKKDVSIQTEDISIQTKDASNLDEYNNMPRIIGVTGKKFNGKDTLGNYLSKYNYKRMAFADPLKEVIKNVFNFNDAQLYGEDKERIDEYPDSSKEEQKQLYKEILERKKEIFEINFVLLKAIAIILKF